MRFSKTVGVVLVIVALIFVFSPKANATITDERVTFTFNQPVEIPGQILPAGTYVFKVVDYAMGDRTLIQVLSQNETHVYGTFMTRPVVRLGREPLITFLERPAGAPPAVDAWFPYHAAQSKNDAASLEEVSGTTGSFSWVPNEGTDGHEFVYPKKKLVAMAKVQPAPQPAPAAAPPAPPAEQPAVAEQAPPKAEEPMVAELQTNNNEQQMNSNNEQQENNAAPEQPATLPKTASSLPLVGFGGLLSLVVAFGLLIVTRRAA